MHKGAGIWNIELDSILHRIPLSMFKYKFIILFPVGWGLLFSSSFWFNIVQQLLEGFCDQVYSFDVDCVLQLL